MCAGLLQSDKANLHAVRAIWPQSVRWTHDEGVDGDRDHALNGDGFDEPGNTNAIANCNSHLDREADEDDSNARYAPQMVFGTALFVAKIV